MKCFYHSADFDGLCSGAIIKKKYPECEMIGINYGDEFPWDDIETGETVFMVDFSLQPFMDMVRLNSMCVLIWIDHHASAIEDARKRYFLANGGQLLTDGVAACRLAWEWCYGDDGNNLEPVSVAMLGLYDVWNHSDDRTLPFQYGMRATKFDHSPDNQFFWNMVFTNEDFFRETIETGRLILDYQIEQNTQEAAAYAFESELFDHKAICINREFCNSQIFDSVYDPEKHHIMISFCRSPKKHWTFSIYSTRDDVDCSAIAKKFGGGGHKGASGFQADRIPFAH